MKTEQEEKWFRWGRSGKIKVLNPGGWREEKLLSRREPHLIAAAPDTNLAAQPKSGTVPGAQTLRSLASSLLPQ